MPILQRDPFAPRFEIIINRNQRLSEDMKKFIKEVIVEDDEKLMDKISITLDTLDNLETGIVQDILDSKLFAPGNLLEVKMGYGNSLQTVGAGYITKPIPNFNETGPTLQIIAYDVFFKMSQRKHEKGRNFKGFRDSQAMTIVAADHGIDFSKVRRFPGITNRFQKIGVNDFEFLREIAEERNWNFYNRFDSKTGKFVLFFEPPTDRQKEVLEFTYFEGEKFPESTLLSFRPQISTVDQASNFKIVSWDGKKKKKITTFFQAGELRGEDDIKLAGKNAEKKLPKNKNGKVIKVKAFGQTLDIIATKPFKNEKESKFFIEAWLKKRLDNFITGNGRMLGQEVIQSRQKHKLFGLGNMLSGKYIFSSVKHVMRRGEPYITEFSARKAVEDAL